jgi:hypothetical protein
VIFKRSANLTISPIKKNEIYEPIVNKKASAEAVLIESEAYQA